MEQIFVKCEPESDDDINDQLFSEEEIKVREIVAIYSLLGKQSLIIKIKTRVANIIFAIF